MYTYDLSRGISDVMTCADWFIYISIYVKRGSLFFCVLMFVLNDLLLNF